MFNKPNKCRVTTGLFSYNSPKLNAEAQAQFAADQKRLQEKADAKALKDAQEQKTKKQPTEFQKKKAQAVKDNKLVRQFKPSVTSVKIPTFDKPSDWKLDDDNEMVWTDPPTKIVYNGPEKFGLESVGMTHPVEVKVFSIKGKPLRSDDAGIGRA